MKNIATTTVLVALCAVADAQFQNVWTTPAYWPDIATNMVIDKVYDVKTDKRGNTYVTGESDQASGGINIVTIKYDRGGHRLWDRSYNNPLQNGVDVPSAMVVDNDGTVWVTGKSQGTDGLYDMLTLRYTTDGTPIPAIRLDAPGINYHYEGVDIALGNDGHVFVAGNRYFQAGMGAPNGTQYVTVRYDQNGNIPDNMNWPAYYDRLPIGNDTAVAIAVGLPGNDVFVTGESRNENTTPFWATIKYPGAGPGISGAPDWVMVEGGDIEPPKISRPWDIAVDANGTSVFVCGTLSGGGDMNMATVSYRGSDGDRRWGATPLEFDGSATASMDEAFAIAIEPDHTGKALFVYVTGAAFMTGGGRNYMTLRYPADSATIHDWATGYNGPANGEDVAVDIEVAGNGNSYVTGRSKNALGTWEWATIKLNKNGGMPISAVRHSAAGNAEANAIALHCAGRAHVAGYAWRTSSEDYMTNPYRQSPSNVSASSFSLDSGSVVSGNLASLQALDSNYLMLHPGPVFVTGTPPVRVVVNGTSSIAEPNELCFEVVAKGSSTSLLQRIELWDYTSGAYVVLDERAATLSDSVVHVAVPYDARRFVQPLTQAVRARVSYVAVGPIFVYPWSASINYTRWEVLD